MNNSKIIATILLSLFWGCQKSPKVEKSARDTVKKASKEVLLIGTFHYNNPGADVAKTKSFDILSESSQKELEQMSIDIKKYNPSKIFVEWPYNEQKELDSLYNLYKKGEYFTNDSLSNFYLKNEIFQLAFRAAKANNNEKIYGVDYSKTEFPYQKVIQDIESNSQLELKEKIESTIASLTANFDSMIEAGVSLKKLTIASNTKEIRQTSNDLHNNMLSLAGSIDEFNGVYLTSEWYKRNLYMWSLIQKYTSDSDERIMVLLGSSHVAMLELFIKENAHWRIKEFEAILSDK